MPVSPVDLAGDSETELTRGGGDQGPHTWCCWKLKSMQSETKKG